MSLKFISILKYSLKIFISFFCLSLLLSNKEIYIKEIKNILFFLEKIKAKETDFSDKLKEIIKKLKLLNDEKNKYKIIKESLNYLKDNNIYNYVDENENLNIFRYFYDNELAIIFLLNKDSENGKHLNERLNPFETTLTGADILSFEYCLEFIQKLKINESSDKDIFFKIKNNIEEDNTILKHFENYSNNFRSLYELDQNFDEKNSVFLKVEENINSGVYYFYKNYDEYKRNGILEENGYDYLYNIKCKISVKSNEKDEKLIEKNKKLKYFENVVNKISNIKYYVNNLREKGSQIELLIEVHFCYDKKKNNYDAKYILDTNEKTFKEINKYLINVNKYYMNLLSKSYLNDEYIRFTYGKQFNFIVDYLTAKNNDNSFANYFLNKIPKKEKYRSFVVETYDSIKYYKTYYQNTISNISNYIKEYFKDNYGNLENFYNNYEVISSQNDNSKYKGICYMNSEKSSIEEEIIDLFIELTGQFPISQNILLINRNTSFEEIESFLYRAILCKYHTLFTIGIIDTSPKQEDYVMKTITYLIKYLFERDNPNIKKNIRKIQANIKPCIAFIYNSKLNKSQSQNKFIDQIKKIGVILKRKTKKDTKENDIKEDKNESLKINNLKFASRYTQSFEIDNISTQLTTKEKFEKIKNNIKIENIMIYLSDVNGTGKTWAIKDDIEKNNFEYVYFPLGGFLSKEKIYNRIKDLLQEIDDKFKNDKSKVCIHLDLYETEQKGTMNDFLLSFLFTKYYKSDENVIYIPKNINIYVEIPNCFSNFIETYPILKMFKYNNLKEINLDNQKKFILSEKEKKLLDLLYEKDVDVDEFIKEKIGIDNPSYYQKRQFINCILSQINENNYGKLDKDKLDKRINSSKHFTSNCFSSILKEKDKNDVDEKEMLQKLSDIYKTKSEDKENNEKNNKDKENNEKNNNDYPLIFYNNKQDKFIEVSMSLEHYKDFEKKKYLSELKEILDLNNPIDDKEKEKTHSELKSLDEILGKEYVITPDNFRKMVKIYYRFISNINLILMGETGCGKTLLIFKLYQLLNNGEEIKDYKLNIHGGFTDEDIIKEIEKLNNKSLQENINNRNKKIWVFIDEINTCNSMGLFNEIICNHSCKGKKLNENLVFIGACNPFRKSNKEQKMVGLTYGHKSSNNILYNVKPLSQSLMNFVYYFGSLSEKDEEEYIKSMIKDIFEKEEDELKDITSRMILKGHNYLKENIDISAVSLREITRFKKCYEFFYNKYFENKKDILDESQIKKEKLDDKSVTKKKSILLSLFTCYLMKIFEPVQREQFIRELQKIETEKEIFGKLIEDNIINKRKHSSSEFENILLLEQTFLLEQIEIDSGIAKNRPLRENIFLLFVAIILNIPIFIIGKPGCSKTLSVNLIDKSMSGKYSKSKFFKKFPALIKTWFQGSESTSSKDVENLFEIAERKADIENNQFYGEHPISLIFFDEIGLCEISDSKPLKILNFKFEYESKKKYLSFIGISNWILDAAKLNRGFTLSVPELHQIEEDVEDTCKEIVESINKYLFDDKKQYKKIFIALYKSYIQYKKLLEKENIDESKNNLCHGSRDFYFLIKNVAYSLNDLLEKNIEYNKEDEYRIVTLAIERNFDSLIINNRESTQIFKEIYLENRFTEGEKKDKIFEGFETKEKDVINNIISNIKDKKSRNLLLISKSSLNLLLVETLVKKLNEINKSSEKKVIPIYKIGSPYDKDKGDEYALKIINQIQEHAKNGDLLILQKFSNILSSLYELFNLNYIIKDGKKYAKISVGNTLEQFIEINDNFKVILLFDEEDVKNIMQPTASRFEKIKLKFSNLLTKEEIKRSDNIKKIIDKLTDIKIKDVLNYDLNSLIVNVDLEEIQSMIFYCKINNISNEKKYIFEKITPALPQDIIGSLIFEGLIDYNEDFEEIKNIFENINKYYNIYDFLKDKINLKKKFSIIYTFSSLSEQFLDDKLLIKTESDIKSEHILEKIILEDFYKDEDLEILAFKIQAKSLEQIIYLKTIIDNFEKSYKNKKDCENKKFIFIIHISRKFKINKKKANEKDEENVNKKEIQKINTISYTLEDTQHLFIDNLKGENDLTLNKIKEADISEFLTKNLNLNEQFLSITLGFFEDEIKKNITETKGINNENFITKMKKYLEKNEELIEKINEIIKKKIQIGNVLKKMFEEKYVKNNSIDIISTLKKYISSIYKKKTYEILDILEKNIFLTTLMCINENDTSNNNESFDSYGLSNDEEDQKNSEEDNNIERNNPDLDYSENEIIKNIQMKYLDYLNNLNDLKNNTYVQLSLLYKIPGLYNLYQDISDYIIKYIKNDFYENERKFRLALPKTEEEKENLIDNFIENNENYIDKIYNYLNSDNIFEILIEQQNSNDKKEFEKFEDLLIKDYITFYLFRQYDNGNNKNNNVDDAYFYDYNKKYINYYPNDAEHKIILKLMDIRFKKKENDNVNIISKTNDDYLKIFIKKILWIESNYDYIISIIKIYNKLSSLKPQNEEDNLYNDIENYIKKGNVKYIAQEKRNPEHTKEVNECFYVILASLCQCITNENILKKFVFDELTIFIEQCDNSLAIINKLSDELLLFLNEKYIIEEFLLIIEGINKTKFNYKDFSINILMKLKNLSNVIQTDDENNKIENLINCFLDLNKYILNEFVYDSKDGEDDINKDKINDLLSNFYLKEYKRLNDINYRVTILEEVLNNDEVIKNSMEMFKLIFKNILQPEIDKFEKILDKFDKQDDNIYKMIEQKDSIILEDTLLYLFEKHIFIYFEKAELLDDKIIKKNKFPTYLRTGKSRDIISDKEPLELFSKCLDYLQNINNPNPKTQTKNKKMKKIFCLAFIRVYIYKLIYTIKDGDIPNFNDVVEKINGNKLDNKLKFMIKIYLYKIIFNIYGRDIKEMKNVDIIKKFNLRKIDNNYETFIKKEETYIFLKDFLLPKEKDDINNFEHLFLKIKSFENNKYNVVDINSIKNDLNIYGDDLFYIITSNLLSNNLEEIIDFNDSEIQNNFWNNIIDKIYKKETKNLLKHIFNVSGFKKLLKNYNIKKEHIEMLLYSMRFCFKTILSSNNDCLYKKILLGDKDCAQNSYLIGNDIKENNYYDIYLELKEHFKNNRRGGVYVCKCKKGSYKYYQSGYPTIDKDYYMKCDNCNEYIFKYSNSFSWIYSYAAIRDGYVRIFKDKEEIALESKDHLDKIKYQTLEEFKNEKIIPLIYNEEPGVAKVKKEHFMKKNKDIRFINNQITYRLLNFILYSHLFFGKIMNNIRIELPTNMNIIEVLEEDWKLLKEALGKKKLKIFINLVFKEITDELINCKEINKISDLFEKEKKLELIITNNLKKYSKYKKEYTKSNEKLIKIEFDSPSNLLREDIDYSLYKEDLYPFYKYFLFTNYIYEKNININNDINKEKNILLYKYIYYLNGKDNEKEKKFIKKLETLDTFNKFLNLLYDTYNNKITREYAETKKLNEELVYEKNKPLCMSFFKIIKNTYDNILKEDDTLVKFLIDKNTEESEKLIDIYKEYIKAQNYMIGDLLENKYKLKGFPIYEKINIQSLEKDEIFSFKLKKTCLTEIIFENSFRKDNFRDIEINYNKIEDKLTDKLLMKVKLVNDNLRYIIYNNEEYLHKNTSIFNEFINNFKPLEDLSKKEKKEIKKYFDNVFKSKEQCINILNDFSEIIICLNNKYKIYEEKIKRDKINQMIKEQNEKVKKETNENNNNEINKNEIIESKNDNNDITTNEEKKEVRETKEGENEKNKTEEEEIKKLKTTQIRDIINNKEFIQLSNYNFSNEFNDFLKIKENFTVDKLINIFSFLEKLMFIVIIKNDEDIKNSCKEKLEGKESEINSFYNNEKFITKEILTSAIRIFITRYLIRGNIKNNKRNFIKYFYIEDLWANEINENKIQKDSEIKLIKNMNISINQILSLYDFLEGDNYINEELNELKEVDQISNEILLNYNQIQENNIQEENPDVKNEPQEEENSDDDNSNSYAKDDDDDDRD